MVNVYEDNVDGDKTKVFLALESGKASTITLGNHAVSKKCGIQFYVDDHVALQLNKTEFYMDGLTPKLRLKDGEEIEVPEKTEKEKEIERLKRELAELENAE